MNRRRWFDTTHLTTLVHPTPDRTVICLVREGAVPVTVPQEIASRLIAAYPGQETVILEHAALWILRLGDDLGPAEIARWTNADPHWPERVAPQIWQQLAYEPELLTSPTAKAPPPPTP